MRRKPYRRKYSKSTIARLSNDDPYRFVPEVDITDIERAIAQDGSFEPLPIVGTPGWSSRSAWAAVEGRAV